MGSNASKPSIHPLAILGAVLFAALLLVLAAVLLCVGRVENGGDANSPNAQVVTVIPAPTETPVNIIPTPLFTPTPTVMLVPPPGVMGVGAYVKVSNTGGAGLRIRTEATTDSLTQFVAMDEEVFEVIGGPVEKNAFTWWQLSAPYDRTRTGWAAQEYLELIILQTPSPMP